MKLSKIFLFLCITSIISCLDLLNQEDRKSSTEFIESKISEYLGNRKYPDDYDSLIACFDSDSTLITDLISVNSLDNFFDKYNVPKELASLINSSLKYSITNNLSNKAETLVNKLITKREEFIVMAVSDGSYVLIYLIHSVITANLHPLYNKVSTEVCEKNLFGKKCHTEYVNEEREPNKEELEVINAAIMAKMAEEVWEK